jgi:hypothetical protein
MFRQKKTTTKTTIKKAKTGKLDVQAKNKTKTTIKN